MLVKDVTIEETEVVSEWYRREYNLLCLCREHDVVDLEDVKSLWGDMKRVKVGWELWRWNLRRLWRREGNLIDLKVTKEFVDTFESVARSQRRLAYDFIKNTRGREKEKEVFRTEVCVIANLCEKIFLAQ